MKFKVGDRVRYVGDDKDSPPPGTTGTMEVVYPAASEWPYYVRWDRPGFAGVMEEHELAKAHGTVAPENRSRVDAGPNWGVPSPGGAK